MIADAFHFPDFPATDPRFPEGARPTWEVALGFPPQGEWTPDDYFALEDHLGSGFRAELVDGCLEVLPVPTELHQFIAGYLFMTLKAWVTLYAPGKVAFTGLRVRLSSAPKPKYREPDIVYMRSENAHRRHKKFWEGADLAMEIVSDDPKDLERDYETKLNEYAAARIPEYWIIDPNQRRIRVYALKGDAYELHGEFLPGQRATSVLLTGFSVSVDVTLAGGEDQ